MFYSFPQKPFEMVAKIQLCISKLSQEKGFAEWCLMLVGKIPRRSAYLFYIPSIYIYS